MASKYARDELEKVVVEVEKMISLQVGILLKIFKARFTCG